MKTSSNSTLLSLYKKDLMSVKFESLMIFAAIFLGHLYFAYKITTGWQPFTILGTSTMLFFLAIFIILLGTFSSVRREWNNNTIYLIMSLPVDGKRIFFSKLLTVMTQLIVLGGTSALMGILFSLYFLGSEFILEAFGFLSNYQLFEVLLKVITLSFLTVIQMIIFAFFSTMIGYLFKKFSGVITFVTFIMTNILAGKIMALVNNAITPIENQFDHILMNPSPGSQIMASGILSSEFFVMQVVAIFLISAVFFFFAAALYDKKVEL
ncbi:ABC transporter permease [Clostridium formicaceticum]|uniref:ABC-2 family transporter protein n=1 Tax=Clostridium formicaceticum TaxID=1497 RepID=A0AAC9WGC4_9CLOT|nr:ABC transporter permease [Clostridium formicaceticum]AOY77143.1 hypothetical protein BJL90_15580 [Clostridium formicaceticum]ARE87659.1 ABC-2 family transporter protein [Clostridium formicaceticum]